MTICTNCQHSWRLFFKEFKFKNTVCCFYCKITVAFYFFSNKLPKYAESNSHKKTRLVKNWKCVFKMNLQFCMVPHRIKQIEMFFIGKKKVLKKKRSIFRFYLQGVERNDKIRLIYVKKGKTLKKTFFKIVWAFQQFRKIMLHKNVML